VRGGEGSAWSDRSPVLLIASLAANFKLWQFCSYASIQMTGMLAGGPPLSLSVPAAGPHVSTTVGRSASNKGRDGSTGSEYGAPKNNTDDH